MSRYGDIIDAIIAAVTPDLAGYTVQGFFSNPGDLDIEDYPIAMLFNPTDVNPRADGGAITDEIAFTCWLFRAPDEDGGRNNVDALRDDVDAVKARFDVNPRITATVDYAHVANVDIIENLSEYLVAVLTIQTVTARA